MLPSLPMPLTPIKWPQHLARNCANRSLQKLALMGLLCALTNCYSPPNSRLVSDPYGYEDSTDHTGNIRRAAEMGLESPDQKMQRIARQLIAALVARRVMAKVPGEVFVDAALKQYNSYYLTNPNIRNSIDSLFPYLDPILRQQLTTAIGSMAASGTIPVGNQVRGAVIETLREVNPELVEDARVLDFVVYVIQRLG